MARAWTVLGSAAVHGVVIAAAALLTRQRPRAAVEEPPILLVRTPRPPVKKSGDAPKPQGPRATAPHRPLLRVATAAPLPAPEPELMDSVEEEPDPPDAFAAEFDAPGEPGGVIGGGPSGAPSSGDGPPGPAAFDPGSMQPPRAISGPDPAYTPEAIEHEVEGTMRVACVITVDGDVRGCRVLQGLPFMDRAVVEALERRRYSPARLAGGRAVETEYVFVIRLRLP